MGERRKQALEKFHRDSIMDAAGELFGKKGIDGTTMDDIAKLADYSKSTIYVYFKSKEDDQAIQREDSFVVVFAVSSTFWVQSY